MSETSRFCQHCGAPLTVGANFCEACGQPVSSTPVVNAPFSPPPPAASSAPAPVARPVASTAMPPSPPPPPFTPLPAAAGGSPARKKNQALPIVLGAVGCLGLLCLAAMIVGVVLYANRSKSPTSADAEATPGAVAAVPIQDATETEPPAPESSTTPEPSPTPAPTDTPEPTATAMPSPTPDPGRWSNDVDQSSSKAFFSDNFSDNQFDWPDSTTDLRTWSFEDGHYVASLFQEEYMIWAYLPIDFIPTEIGFDAALAPGYGQQGSYGIVCNYQDEDNFDYILVDPPSSTYSFGRYIDNESSSLADGEWMNTDQLRNSSTSINQVAFFCTTQGMKLYINGGYVDEVQFDPVPSGKVGLYLATWEDMPPEGAKVWFDNLYAFIE